MIGEIYPYLDSSDEFIFTFISTGLQGNIIKIILFEEIPESPNTYNLAFGDWKNNDIDDKVISNNGDLQLVMNTVANTMYLFLEKRPDSTIIFQGVDEKRANLYQLIIKRKFVEIEPIFNVQGLNKGNWEEFNPKKVYIAFKLSLKN